LLWLQYNELEVVVYKPQQVLSLFAEWKKHFIEEFFSQINKIISCLLLFVKGDETSIIKSARVGHYVGQYIHSTVNVTTQNIIRDLARNITQTATAFRDIQKTLRVELRAKLGGSWLVIVTSATFNYDSDWDSNFKINFAMEFDLGSLRFFVYQKII
jgi:hypothetical protein